VFVAGLLVSTIVIVYLESQSQPDATPRPAALVERVSLNLEQAKQDLTAHPASAETQAAFLVAYANAARADVVSTVEAVNAVEPVLAELERRGSVLVTGQVSALMAIAIAAPPLEDRIGRLVRSD
jgi:hypothetical protein